MSKLAMTTRLRELSSAYENGSMARDALSDTDLLTLLLSSTSRPSLRMARIAQQVLNAGGLPELARALVNAPEGLRRFGLSAHEITRLTLAYELVTRCAWRMSEQKTQIRSADDAATLFREHMLYLDHEELHVLVLNTKNQVVEYVRLYKGTVNASCLRAAEIFRPALLRNCPSIIVAHNHPSGSPQPSPEDLAVTRQLVEAGKVLDIDVLDHLIVGNPRYTSLKQVLAW